MTHPRGGHAWLTACSSLAALLLTAWSGPWLDLRGDEQPYACAFQAMGAGLDPYLCDRFLYPPPMAALGGWLLRIVPLPMLFSLLRTANAVGLGWLAATSAAHIARPGLGRWAAAAILVLLAPGSEEALQVGNVSPLVVALMWSALGRWPRQPALAGAMLGASIIIKPIALAALPLLALAPWPERRAASRACSAYAGAVVLGAHLPWLPLLPSMLAHAPRHEGAICNVSSQRVAHLLGLPSPPQTMVLLAATIAVGALLWRARPSAARASNAIVVACLLSLPVVWNHTYVAAWPIASAAVGDAWRAFARARPGPDRSRSLLSLLLVGHAACWTFSTNALTWVSELLPARANAFPTVVAMLLPAALCWWHGRASGRTTQSPARRPPTPPSPPRAPHRPEREASLP
jgi:hypothetical protein